jgi:hypothetical protein
MTASPLTRPGDLAPPSRDVDARAVITIRMLAADAVQAAGSGHPGLPMGAAGPAYVLWSRFLRHDPACPDWPDRDRFVLSAGHGSALLYALLHVSGHDLSRAELRASDGDLMEGISHEAASLAGHLRLGAGAAPPRRPHRPHPVPAGAPGAPAARRIRDPGRGQGGTRGRNPAGRRPGRHGIGGVPGTSRRGPAEPGRDSGQGSVGSLAGALPDGRLAERSPPGRGATGDRGSGVPGTLAGARRAVRRRGGAGRVRCLGPRTCGHGPARFHS